MHLVFTTAGYQKGCGEDPEKLWRGDHSRRCQSGPRVLVPAAICRVSFTSLLWFHCVKVNRLTDLVQFSCTASSYGTKSAIMNIKWLFQSLVCHQLLFETTLPEELRLAKSLSSCKSPFKPCFHRLAFIWRCFSNCYTVTLSTQTHKDEMFVQPEARYCPICFICLYYSPLSAGGWRLGRWMSWASSSERLSQSRMWRNPKALHAHHMSMSLSVFFPFTLFSSFLFFFSQWGASAQSLWI